MNRTQKEQIVGELQSDLGNAVSVVFADLTGVDVDTVNILRDQFRGSDVQCRVAKNTLIKLAIKDSPMEVVNPVLVGPTAMVWHNEEPAAGAKILKAFLKEHKDVTIELKGGYIDGELLGKDDAMKLADMLGKNELRGQMLGLMKMVPGKFLALLNTPARQFLGVLEARRQKLEEEGGA